MREKERERERERVKLRCEKGMEGGGVECQLTISRKLEDRRCLVVNRGFINPQLSRIAPSFPILISSLELILTR